MARTAGAQADDAPSDDGSHLSKALVGGQVFRRDDTKHVSHPVG
jgi:hypothetical protein